MADCTSSPLRALAQAEGALPAPAELRLRRAASLSRRALRCARRAGGQGAAAYTDRLAKLPVVLARAVDSDPGVRARVERLLLPGAAPLHGDPALG